MHQNPNLRLGANKNIFNTRPLLSGTRPMTNTNITQKNDPREDGHHLNLNETKEDPHHLITTVIDNNGEAKKNVSKNDEKEKQMNLTESSRVSETNSSNNSSSNNNNTSSNNNNNNNSSKKEKENSSENSNRSFSFFGLLGRNRTNSHNSNSVHSNEDSNQDQATKSDINIPPRISSSIRRSSIPFLDVFSNAGSMRPKGCGGCCCLFLIFLIPLLFAGYTRYTSSMIQPDPSPPFFPIYPDRVIGGCNILCPDACFVDRVTCSCDCDSSRYFPKYPEHHVFQDELPYTQNLNPNFNFLPSQQENYEDPNPTRYLPQQQQQQQQQQPETDLYYNSLPSLQEKLHVGVSATANGNLLRTFVQVILTPLIAILVMFFLCYLAQICCCNTRERYREDCREGGRRRYRHR